jgi:PPOX class probable F420-dependent enzyme
MPEHAAMTTISPDLRPFVNQKTVLLTTYRRNGEGVETAVSLAVDGDRAVFRTWHTAGKVKRLRNNPVVTVTPSSFLGKPTGAPLQARVRRLEGAEAARAAELLGTEHPTLQRVLVPFGHKLMRVETVHYELRPLDPAS